MIPSAAARTLLRLTDVAAALVFAAIGAALVLEDPYAAVPHALRPGAWSQDTISAVAALALIVANVRLLRGWRAGWLIWAGLVGLVQSATGYRVDVDAPIRLAAAMAVDAAGRARRKSDLYANGRRRRPSACARESALRAGTGR